MPASKPHHSLDELAILGGNIFSRQVKPSLRPEDDGKFVAIDVDEGEYEIDEDDYTAVMRLKSRNPDAEVWLARAGYPISCRISRSNRFAKR